MENETLETGQGASVPRQQVWLRRMAVYACFVLAGWAVVAAWCVLVMGSVAAALHELFWPLVLPGPAAALGAVAVHRPFMRAVSMRRSPAAHGWAAAGVVAAHAAYGLLVFIAELAKALYQHSAWHLPLQSEAALGQAWEMAWGMALVSVILGMLPNLLIAQGFAGFMVRARRGRLAALPVLEVQPIPEGAGNEFAGYAE